LTARGRAGSITAHHRAARKAVREGDLRLAHEHCLAILAIDPGFADAWFLCGVIAAHNGQVKKSVEILQKAIMLAPENAEYLSQLGKQLVALREIPQALHTARQAYALNPSAATTLNTLGTVFSHCGDHATALACYERSILALPRSAAPVGSPSHAWQADLYFNLGASLQFAGRFADAENAFEQAIILQPRLFKAHSALSLLRPQTPERNHLHRLQMLRGTVLNPQEQLHLGHAIAKEQEDLQQYGESLVSLEWAKQAQAAKVAYRANTDAALFASIRQIFTAEFCAGEAPGCDSPEPIFIVGMPRTGTTLVEQILASHSQVYAAGELQNFPLLVKRMTQTPSADVIDTETVQRSAQLEMAALGTAYLDSTRPDTDHHAHFIDKLPLNVLYLGLIKRALPNAKLICLRRDPMDTCLSNYRQLFATNFKYYHYNYDLLDCGRYFIEFDRLVRHWREVLPDAIYELQYETLVASPERVTRELLAHCGLPWEGRCLSFHQRKSSVATASSVQVRKDIYTSSVNRWQRYGDELKPLYELLHSAGFYS